MEKRSNLGRVLAVVAGIGLGATACGDESSSLSADQAALRGGQRPDGVGLAGQGGDGDVAIDESGEGYVPGDELPPGFCEHGGSVSRIDVAFDCDSITIISCKDLSNVVLEFEDGTRQKFDGLSGQSATFSGTGDNAGKTVTGVWVKAGANASGDGPGYGERFDAPGEMACEETPPGDGDGDGDSGDGDGDGDSGDGDGDGDSGDGDGDGDGDECGGLDEDCGGEVPPTPPAEEDGCMSVPGFICDPI